MTIPEGLQTYDDDALLTPSEVASMFRVNPKTVTRWARAGKISAIRTLGGHRRFRAREIRQFLEQVDQSELSTEIDHEGERAGQEACGASGEQGCRGQVSGCFAFHWLFLLFQKISRRSAIPQRTRRALLVLSTTTFSAIRAFIGFGRIG